jgi:hypothetical protein
MPVSSIWLIAFAAPDPKQRQIAYCHTRRLIKFLQAIDGDQCHPTAQQERQPGVF